MTTSKQKALQQDRFGVLTQRLTGVLVFSLLGLLSGCISTQYALVESDDTQFGDLQVSIADSRWNLAPQSLTQHLHAGSSVWTRDGILLDQLMFLAPIEHEQPLFVSAQPAELVYPTFRKEMLPNEVEELVQDSLVRQLGSQASVSTNNLRPRRLGEQRAVAFDLLIEFSDGATRKGHAVASIVNDALHVAIYQATRLYYFDKHWGAASAVIDSARLPVSAN